MNSQQLKPRPAKTKAASSPKTSRRRNGGTGTLARGSATKPKRSRSTLDPAVGVAIDEALRLHGDGKPFAAVKILAPVAAKHPKVAAVWGCLGSAYMDAGNWSAAVEAYRNATELSPASERGSIGLFISLFETGAAQAALGEMRRFLTLADSEEYAAILRDMAVDGRLVLRAEPATAA